MAAEKQTGGDVKTIFPWPIWLVVIAALVLYCIPLHAEPFAQVTAGGVTIQIHKEAFALKEITNLPKRATWDQEGKHFEGCAGITPDGVVLTYFEDRTVTAIPVQAFARVTGA